MFNSHFWKRCFISTSSTLTLTKLQQLQLHNSPFTTANYILQLQKLWSVTRQNMPTGIEPMDYDDDEHVKICPALHVLDAPAYAWISTNVYVSTHFKYHRLQTSQTWLSCKATLNSGWSHDLRHNDTYSDYINSELEKLISTNFTCNLCKKK